MACAGLSAPAQAYGRDGHRIICDLAYRHLSDAARREIDRLVALDSDFAHFRDTCSWADEVRGSTHRHTASWHYINQTRDDPHIDPEDCAEDGCITEAIDLHAGIFADRSRSDAERLEALKFLAHWMGDVHQPLHVSIEGDRGGNDILVLWRGERHTNLHRVWDSEILRDHMSEEWPWAPEAERWQYFADELESEIPARRRRGLCLAGRHRMGPGKPRHRALARLCLLLGTRRPADRAGRGLLPALAAHQPAPAQAGRRAPGRSAEPTGGRAGRRGGLSRPARRSRLSAPLGFG